MVARRNISKTRSKSDQRLRSGSSRAVLRVVHPALDACRRLRQRRLTTTCRDRRGAPGRRPSARGAGLRARRGRSPAHSRSRTISSASATRCSTSSSVTRSSRCNAAMRSKIRSAIVGASPIDGSSSSKRRGAEAMPRPIASICCSPPDSVPAIWRRRSASTGNSVKMRSRLRAQSARPRTRVGAHFEVFEDRQRGENLPPLRHMRDAEMGALGGGTASRSRPSNRILPPAGVDRAGDRLEQRRLAGAVRADDRDELSLADGQRHAAQRRQPAIADREAVDLKHRASIACSSALGHPPRCSPAG